MAYAVVSSLIKSPYGQCFLLIASWSATYYIRVPGSSTEERVYDELYTGDVWLAAHQELQKSPPVPGCNLPRAIIALMLGSDAAHLTQFGQAYIWPVYLWFGNISKWDRRRPSSRVCEHIAYIPKLSDTVKAEISRLLGAKVSPALLAFCKRELFHACWRSIVDEDFLKAYQDGIVISCSDGITRRLYPRVFTYSADYPEKVLIASIKDFGSYPCPQCLIPKKEIPQLGLQSDLNHRHNKRKDDNERQIQIYKARQALYEQGYVANSSIVYKELDHSSSVPTVNAFSERLRRFESFDLYRMLVPDVLHEFELGVWKSFFSHLIRMLHTLRTNAVEEFDSRMRQINTFPPDTIRTFRHNVSDMRKFAARDFEDVLQCCIPCFEGLFTGRDDEDIRTLIFTFGYWHAIAKLRMHTPTTISLIRTQTRALGRRLRRFASDIAPHYATTETDQEAALRSRREVRQALAAGKAAGGSRGGKRPTQFSLVTYKLHALGNVADGIEQFGTTDSYSTQICELEHRRAKAQARRTNYNILAPDIARYERRETHLLRHAQALSKIGHTSMPREPTDPDGKVADDPAEPEADSPMGNQDDCSYRISDRGRIIYIGAFLQAHLNDPATTDFVPKLEDHILSRIYPRISDFSPAMRQELHIPSGSMRQHATIGIKYTTYDVQQAQDTINPSTRHHFIQMLDSEADQDHPFWYGKVIGIYHVNIHHPEVSNQKLTRFDVVWVRWLEVYTPGGWDDCQYDRLKYAEADSSLSDTFGFVNPATIIRAVHLIPAFHYGRHARDAGTPRLIGADDPDLGDWKYYYVNRLVNRDTVMRYLGIGIGHLAPSKATTTSAPSPDPDTAQDHRAEMNETFDEAAASEEEDDEDDEAESENREQEGPDDWEESNDI